eukprot:gene9900-10948_t
MRPVWRLTLCLFLSLSLFLLDVSSVHKISRKSVSEDKKSRAAATAVRPLSPEYGELPLTNFTLGCALNYNSQTDRPHKVLLFVGQSYHRLLLNWLVYYRTACRNSTAALNRVEIFCLDGNMTALLEESQLHCTSLFHGQSLWQSSQQANQSSSSSWVWLKRLEIITSLLKQGHDLLLSDLDALWLSSPYQDINRYATESHVIASRGWFPRDLSKLWGTTFCMGFFFVKASSFSVEFFDAVLGDMRQQQVEFEAYHLWRRSPQKTASPYHHRHPVTGELLTFNHSLWEKKSPEGPDDQVAVNNVLYRWQVQWSTSMNRSFRHLDHHGWVTSPKEGKRNNRVTFLSEGRFVRNCLNNNIKRLSFHRFPVRATARALNKRLPSAVLAHCILPPGQSRVKEIYLAYYSLWQLPYNDTEVRLFVRNDHKPSKFKTAGPSLIAFMEGSTAFSRNKTKNTWAMSVEDWKKLVMSQRAQVRVVVPSRRNRTEEDVD